MINDELIKYITIQKSRGISRENISTKLITAGWHTDDVKEGLDKVFIATTPSVATPLSSINSAQTASPATPANSASQYTPMSSNPIQNSTPQTSSFVAKPIAGYGSSPSPSTNIPPKSEATMPNLMPKVQGPAGAVPMGSVPNTQNPNPAPSAFNSFTPMQKPQQTPVANVMSTGPLPQGAVTSSYRKDYQNIESVGGRRKSHWGRFFFVLFLIIVLGLGGVVFANVKGYISLPFDIPFLKPSPEQIMSKVKMGLSDLDTFHVDTKATIKVSGESTVPSFSDDMFMSDDSAEPISGTIEMEIKTDYDLRDENISKFSSNLEFSLSALDFFKISLDTDVVAIGETLYFKLPQKFVQNIFDGEEGIEWVSLSKTDLDNKELYTTIESQEYDSKKLEEIAQIITDSEFVSSAEYIGMQKVNNENLRQYNITIAKENLRSVFNKLILAIDDPSFEGANKEIREMLDSIGDIDLNIWVAKGNVLRKFEASTQMNYTSDGITAKVEINVESTISKFNESLPEIVAPSPVHSITEILQEAQKDGADMEVKSYLSNARVEAELFHEDSNSYGVANTKGSCTSPVKGSMFYSISSLTPLIENENISTSCYSTSKAYAISATMPSDPTMKWCIDSNGFSGETTNPLEGTMCK